MANERQKKLLEYINKHSEATNAELAALIGEHSAMTLWRDLKQLEDEGRIIRIRGGATATQNKIIGEELPFRSRTMQNAESKDEIARIAAEIIHPNRSFYLDGGSTTFSIMKYLKKDNLTIVTSAANTAAELVQRDNVNITLLGGQVNSYTLSCTGYQTESMLSDLNIDIAILSPTGYSNSSGFTGVNPAEARLKKLVINKSSFTIILIDHWKIGRQYPFTFAHLSDVDLVIGDSSMPADFVQSLKDNNILFFHPDDNLKKKDRMQLLRKML